MTRKTLRHSVERPRNDTERYSSSDISLSGSAILQGVRLRAWHPSLICYCRVRILHCCGSAHCGTGLGIADTSTRFCRRVYDSPEPDPKENQKFNQDKDKTTPRMERPKPHQNFARRVCMCTAKFRTSEIRPRGWRPLLSGVSKRVYRILHKIAEGRTEPPHA